MNRVNLICKDITGFITVFFFGLICKDITGLEQLDKAAMLVDKTVQIPVNILIPDLQEKICLVPSGEGPFCSCQLTWLP